MKKRERVFKKIEKLMERLSPKVQTRVAFWVARRWSENLVDQGPSEDEPVPPPPVGDAWSRPVSDAGVLGGADGIFNMDPGDTALDDAEMAGHVYGFIRMGLKEEALSRLAQLDQREAIIRGTGRQDLFGPKNDVEKVYEILEQLVNDAALPPAPALDVAFAALEDTVRKLLSAREPLMVLATAPLIEQHRECLTVIVRQNTHECMLPMINDDPYLRQHYWGTDGGIPSVKHRVVDLWNRLRIELGLAYEPPNQ